MWQEYEQGKRVIKTFKSMKRKDAKRFFEEIQSKKNIEDIVFHFRLTSHGETSLDNCHPFKTNHNQYMVHNGCLDIWDITNVKSDTRLLAEFIQKLPKNWIDDDVSYSLVDNFCEGSKLIFMTPDDTFIINEKNGIIEDEIWFSNSSHKWYVYSGKLYSGVSWTYPTKSSLYGTRKEFEEVDELDDDYFDSDSYWEDMLWKPIKTFTKEDWEEVDYIKFKRDEHEAETLREVDEIELLHNQKS